MFICLLIFTFVLSLIQFYSEYLYFTLMIMLNLLGWILVPKWNCIGCNPLHWRVREFSCFVKSNTCITISSLTSEADKADKPISNVFVLVLQMHLLPKRQSIVLIFL